MSQMRGKNPKGRAKKLRIKKEPAVKDLEPKRGLRAGAASRSAEFLRMAKNHNETLVCDPARKRGTK